MARQKKLVIPKEYCEYSEKDIKQCSSIDIKYVETVITELESKYRNNEYDFVIDSVKNLYKYLIGEESKKIVKKVLIKNSLWFLQRMKYCKSLCNDYYSLDKEEQELRKVLFKKLLCDHIKILVDNEL
jgi:hypothetical protein